MQPLSLRQKLRGHLQTLRPFLERSLRPPERPPTVPWCHEFIDEEAGPVTLTGRWYDAGTKSAVVVVHGLGGSTNSGYMALALNAARRRGRSCLLLNCRGADRLGTDIYHSGLTADIAESVRSEPLSKMETIDVFGYSIGGHIALRYATREMDGRVRKVAAVGSPLHLASAADDFDTASFNVYRTHVMDALKEIYTPAFQRRPQGLHPIEARKIQRIREWDEKIIAPRFGYSSASDYYEKESVGPRLDELRCEALYVGATCDPMVLAESVLPFVGAPRLTSVWDESAGHLGFSANFDMQMPGPLGVEDQVFAWFEQP